MKSPRLGLLIALLLFAPLALAMPDGGFSEFALFLEQWGSYIVVAAEVAYSAYSADRARKASHDAYNSSLKDRITTVRGATEPRAVVLGRQRVGGVLTFIGSTGPNKEHLVMVIALAAHECDAIEDIYFDDIKVEFVGEYVSTEPYARTDLVSQNDDATGDGSTVLFNVSVAPVAATVTAVQTSGSGEGQNSISFAVSSVSGTAITLATAPTGPFTFKYQARVTTYFARVRRFLGGPGQTVDSVVQGLFPDGTWDASHPMSGCAGLAVFFDFNEDAFQTQPNVSAVMRGAKLYDPRMDSTAGGSGSHRVNDPTTWQWSENPALQIAYVAMSPLLGRQPASSVRWSDVAAAANVCDTQVDYATWGAMTDETGTFLTDESDVELLI